MVEAPVGFRKSSVPLRPCGSVYQCSQGPEKSYKAKSFYWVGQKVTSYRKTQMKFLANPIQSHVKVLVEYVTSAP